jgi:hypothetical protein
MLRATFRAFTAIAVSQEYRIYERKMAFHNTTAVAGGCHDYFLRIFLSRKEYALFSCLLYKK